MNVLFTVIPVGILVFIILSYFIRLVHALEKIADTLDKRLTENREFKP